MPGPIVNLIVQKRYEKLCDRLESHFLQLGNIDGAQVFAKIRSNAEAMEMFQGETEVAYATSCGVSVTDDGGREFLRFRGKLLEGRPFANLFKWVMENPDKVLEFAKMIVAIIGLF